MKRSLRKPSYRWEDNIKVNLRETGSEVLEWLQIDWDRVQSWALVNMVMNLWVP
jgi:hypothetical protein